MIKTRKKAHRTNRNPKGNLKQLRKAQKKNRKLEKEEE